MLENLDNGHYLLIKEHLKEKPRIRRRNTNRISGEKYCVGCDKMKTKATDYYKAGPNTYQKLCKCCHNKSRKKYKVKSNYKKRPVGFVKLPIEIQKKIIIDLNDNEKTIIEIYREYHEECPELKYNNLLRWCRNGNISLDISSIEKNKTTIDSFLNKS